MSYWIHTRRAKLCFVSIYSLPHPDGWSTRNKALAHRPTIYIIPSPCTVLLLPQELTPPSPAWPATFYGTGSGSGGRGHCRLVGYRQDANLTMVCMHAAVLHLLSFFLSSSFDLSALSEMMCAHRSQIFYSRSLLFVLCFMLIYPQKNILFSVIFTTHFLDFV